MLTKFEEGPAFGMDKLRFVRQILDAIGGRSLDLGEGSSASNPVAPALCDKRCQSEGFMRRNCLNTRVK